MQPTKNGNWLNPKQAIKKVEEQPSSHVKPPNGPGIGCPRYFWKLGGWGGLQTGKLFENLFKKQSDSRHSPHLVEKWRSVLRRGNRVFLFWGHTDRNKANTLYAILGPLAFFPHSATQTLAARRVPSRQEMGRVFSWPAQQKMAQ